jgi:hypothetical protein
VEIVRWVPGRRVYLNAKAAMIAGVDMRLSCDPECNVPPISGWCPKRPSAATEDNRISCIPQNDPA